MTILLKKVIRSMNKNKKAYVSCILLMGIGVSFYICMQTSIEEINIGKKNYYEQNRLADAFASVNKIPKGGLLELQNIDGIKKVDGRIVFDYNVYQGEDVYENIILKLISAKDDSKRLNNYYLNGQDLKDSNDILIGTDFYNAHNYNKGDQISFIMNNRQVDFTIVGDVLTPEYVYILQDSTQLISDASKYNIGYIDEKTYMSLTNMDGYYNDISIEFEDHIQFEDMKDKIASTLNKYGVIAIYSKDNLISYEMLETEIETNKSMATSIPVLFIAMSSVVLYLMLGRIIEQDRSQIGMMKAFGYSDTKILTHYILYGLITGFLGSIVGVVIGVLFTRALIDLYLSYFKIPLVGSITTYRYFYIGSGLSVLGGIIGAYFGAKSVLKLSPSDAMRAKTPSMVKKEFILKSKIFKYLLTNSGFMSLRNIGRNKLRSAFIIIGIIFSFSMIAIIGMMTLAMVNMMSNQYSKVLKYDGEIVLNQPIEYDKAVKSVRNLENITIAQGILKEYVSVSNSFKSATINLIGIPKESQLYLLYDDDRKYNIPIIKDKIVLSSIVAKKIDVKKGDYIYLQNSKFKNPIKIYVSDVVIQGVGSNGYIDISTMSNLLGKDLIASSIIFNTDNINNVKKQLLPGKNVKTVINKKESEIANKKMVSTYSGLIYFMQLVSILIAFVIIYNTSIISLSQRSREYATLRIMGMYVSEVSAIMNFEYWILCFVGVMLGVPFSMLLHKALLTSLATNSYSLPDRIPYNAYVIATIGCIIAVFFSNISSSKAVEKLDLAEVLREQ